MSAWRRAPRALPRYIELDSDKIVLQMAQWCSRRPCTNPVRGDTPRITPALQVSQPCSSQPLDLRLARFSGLRALRTDRRQGSDAPLLGDSFCHHGARLLVSDPVCRPKKVAVAAIARLISPVTISTE